MFQPAEGSGSQRWASRRSVLPPVRKLERVERVERIDRALDPKNGNTLPAPPT